MKYKSFLKLLLFGFICAFMAASCTKEGPMGPAGANGSDGINGVDGTNGTNGVNGSDGKDGVDGNDMCLVCHTQAGMDAIGMQYAMSSHNNAGSPTTYAGGRSGCMDCHSNEGHIFHTVGYYPEENLDFASQITCGTCHGDHVSLEAGLEAPMRSTIPVVAKSDGTTVFDFESSSNNCAHCHQSRKNGEYYSDAYEVGDSIFSRDVFVAIQHEDSVYLSSSHASPHYTTMTNTIFGVGGYTAEAGIVMNAHKRAGCVGCHMGDADDGIDNGGHTMVPSVVACQQCHSSATDFDIDGRQTAVNEAEEVVAEGLVHAGILNEDHGAVVGIYHKDVYEAYWNYKIVHYDASSGVHNPHYTTALLDAAKERLGL